MQRDKNYCNRKIECSVNLISVGCMNNAHLDVFRIQDDFFLILYVKVRAYCRKPKVDCKMLTRRPIKDFFKTFSVTFVF